MPKSIPICCPKRLRLIRDTIESRRKRHLIPNDEMKLHQYEEWRDFAENDYYDGTPPPDFVERVPEEY